MIKLSEKTDASVKTACEHH